MKISVVRIAGFLCAALLCLALPAFAQNSNLYFNGGYQGAVWCGGPDGCVATGYYDGTINGVNVGPGQQVAGMLCDDYAHNIYAGESWTANGIDAANLNASNIGSTQFGKTIGLAGYTELAYIANQMFTTNPSSAQQALLSQALWYITGGVSLAQIGGTGGSVYALVQQAIAFYNEYGAAGLAKFANLWVYTPTNQSSSGPQEMWSEVVPEGGAALLYLLLAGASCFGAMFVRSRSQRANPEVA